MATTPQRDITAVQPATQDLDAPSTTSEALGPNNADNHRTPITNLGINEAREMTGFPSISGGANVSMTDAQPGGGPTVTTEAGPY